MTPFRRRARRVFQGPAWGALLFSATLSIAPSAGAAPSDSATFDIYVSGIRAGVLAINGAEKSGRYVAAGKLESTGLLGRIVKVRYDARVTGAVSNAKYVPESYTESADTGKRRSDAVMEYRAGVPQVKKYKPVRHRAPPDLAPETQKGTIDPMTAIYAAFRDVLRDRICTLNVQMFDGQRRSEVRYSNPVPVGEGFTCDGEYRRLAGFTAEELAERRVFPFKVTLAPSGFGEYRVTKMSLTTLFGRAEMTRR